MNKLKFLEISQDIMSYYRTLRDVNYYLTSDTEVEKQNLKAVSHVISKLIYGFIRINGKAFREMDREQYETEFHLFYDDFLSVIQNSGENNVEFDHFTVLVDELIGLAIKRQDTLGKIKNADTGVLTDNIEMIADKTYLEVDIDTTPVTNEVEYLSGSVIDGDVVGLVEDKNIEAEDVKPAAIELVENMADVVTIDNQGEKDIGRNVRFDYDDAKVNFVDVGIVKKTDVNDVINYESDDNYRFRPRKRKHR